MTVLEDLHGGRFLKAIDIVLDAVSQHITRFCRAGTAQMAGEESREAVVRALPASRKHGE